LENKKENIKPKQKKAPRVVRWLEVLDLGEKLPYENITRHIPFVLFLFVLAFVYVANAFYAERAIRDINSINKTLNEKRWYYMTTKFDLEKQSVQSKLSEALYSKGLHQLTAPPAKINADKFKDEH
jgi:hypothetical protein